MEAAFAHLNASETHDWVKVGSALPWMHVVTALFSALASASAVTRATSQRAGGSTSEVPALSLLAASDLLLALCGLLGAAMLVGHAGAVAWYRLHAARQVVCVASFFLTLNYAWNVYARLRHNFLCFPHQLPAQVTSDASGVHTREETTCDFLLQISKRAVPSGTTTALLSCVAPPLLTAPAFIGGSVGGCIADCGAAYGCLLTPVGTLPVAACRPLRVYVGAVFLAAFVFTLVGVLVLMGKCRQISRRLLTAHGYLGDEQRAPDLRMLAHVLVFAVCWAPSRRVGVAGRPPLGRAGVRAQPAGAARRRHADAAAASAEDEREELPNLRTPAGGKKRTKDFSNLFLCLQARHSERDVHSDDFLETARDRRGCVDFLLQKSPTSFKTISSDSL
ncbi:transmembrane protein 116 isoform X2 [Syngnathoides biaculeatus]|uniref:transmembrane protein 116 isoform X2 n=1 Tax=Syngnathoides biaculeatus TaxID=300417 RepID=UPI002ADE40C8|nr:transmembrane protein 116 isoform X2 [Syngnathoides biaculeatus]